ncbi:MAG TPA: S1 family peptidase [Thermoleophilaceae bacterium]|nr:S1 family peptidase [Thermoleophilaceae bacterium]
METKSYAGVRVGRAFGRGSGRPGQILVLALLLFSQALPVSAAPSLDPQVLSTALQYRRTFGLSTDVSAVSALELNPAADRKYSVALNSDEVAEMDRRMAIQEALKPVAEYGQAHPGTFGGMWVDQAAGGVVHLSFTSDVDTHRTALESMTPPGAVLEVHQVSRTEAEVDELVDRISRDVTFHDSLGVTVHNVASNTQRNSVDVFIEPYSAAGAKVLGQRYAADVRILPGKAPQLTVCYSRQNCVGPPIMAGVNNDWNCTVGFGVYKAGYQRFLTAGHCVYQVVTAYGWGGWIWYHSTQSLGYSTAHSWYDMSEADAGVMGNVSASVHSNRVYYSATPSWFGINSAQTLAQSYVGYAICQSGQVSGFACGTITSNNSTPNYGGVRMRFQRQANYLIQVGDSGAPVISQSNTNMAVGLQSGRDSLYVAYYSHIVWVLIRIDAQLRTG